MTNRTTVPQFNSLALSPASDGARHLDSTPGLAGTGTQGRCTSCRANNSIQAVEIRPASWLPLGYSFKVPTGPLESTRDHKDWRTREESRASTNNLSSGIGDGSGGLQGECLDSTAETFKNAGLNRSPIPPHFVAQHLSGVLASAPSRRRWDATPAHDLGPRYLCESIAAFASLQTCRRDFLES